MRHFTPRYLSRGIAFHSASGADREVAYVVLTVAVLSLACFIGLELSLNVMERSDMAWVKVKERLPIL